MPLRHQILKVGGILNKRVAQGSSGFVFSELFSQWLLVQDLESAVSVSSSLKVSAAGNSLMDAVELGVLRKTLSGERSKVLTLVFLDALTFKSWKKDMKKNTGTVLLEDLEALYDVFFPTFLPKKWLQVLCSFKSVIGETGPLEAEPPTVALAMACLSLVSLALRPSGLAALVRACLTVEKAYGVPRGTSGYLESQTERC